MKSRVSLLTFISMLALALLLVTGCAKKKVAAQPPVPPPAQPQPTVTLNVYPADITQGQSAKLTWEAQNATDITIESMGSVQANGSKTVSPSESTSYHIVAKGPGGTSDATARLTVNSVSAATADSGPSLRDLFQRNVKDAFFAYDSYKLDDETSQLIASDAKFLQQHPELKFTVEGHCDERGSEEYNLALGASRAEAVKQALVSQGVDAQRVATNSVGKEKPFCSDSNEECWHQNRRGHFVAPE
ncbi:MAG TPA: peptidoglycan-associated lipoprotein Pal [Terriglobales bacterium]|jgi:peptidoglycan-associated lipoprotein|nr:peptidoglycan-associated lipoprotein Pal [Terriglobales bacterium]